MVEPERVEISIQCNKHSSLYVCTDCYQVDVALRSYKANKPLVQGWLFDE